MDQFSRIPQAQRDTPIPFARTSAILPFVRYLDNAGAPTNSWLAEARMPSLQTKNSDGLVPLATGYRFLALAIDQGGYENIGVAAAEQTSAYELGALGAVLRSASTVREYLKLAVRLSETLSSGGTRFWLRREGDQLRVHQHVSGPYVLGARVAEVYTLVISIQTFRQMLGPTWSPEEISLRAGLEDLLGDWLSKSSLAVSTHQSNTSFTLPLSLLDRPVPANAFLQSKNISGESRGTPLMPQNFLESMECLIDLLIAEGRTDIHNASEAAGLSPRTLQRKLAQTGTSYRNLLMSANLRLAKQRLSDSPMRVTDIAAELGYTNASNFTRTFQNQTGMSPSKYRSAQRR